MNNNRTILEINRIANAFYCDNLWSTKGIDGMKFLSDRGITENIISLNEMGYADAFENNLYSFLTDLGYKDDILIETGLIIPGENGSVVDRFRNRIVIPILDANRNILSFSGISIDKGQPFILNLPNTKIFDKSQYLYGLNHIDNQFDELILCESYWDVIANQVAGIRNAISFFGEELLPGHINTIKNIAKKVYICFDSDDFGRDKANKASELINEAGIQCSIVNLKPARDTAEFIRLYGQSIYVTQVGMKS